MQFMIKALDGENMLEKRLAVRGRHLENMKSIKQHVLCAGGLLDEEGKMKGSLLVLEFDDRLQLEEYLQSEPYIQEKVWEKVEVERMNTVILDRDFLH